MKQYFTLLLVLIISNISFSEDSIKLKKNYIGIDINYFEFSFLYGLSANTNIRYIHTFHKRFDLKGMLGATYPYLFTRYTDEDVKFRNFIVGKFSLVPCYVPLRRENKALQFGLGYAAEFQKEFIINGITVHLNYTKQSKKRNFAYGVNFYNDLLFFKNVNFPFYKVGVGFFVGGIF